MRMSRVCIILNHREWNIYNRTVSTTVESFPILCASAIGTTCKFFLTQARLHLAKKKHSELDQIRFQQLNPSPNPSKHCSLRNSGSEQLVDFEGGSRCHLKMCWNFSQDVPLCCSGSRACEKEGVQSITAQCYIHTLLASREIHYIRASLPFFSLSHENEYTGGGDDGVGEIEIYPGVAKSGRRGCFAAPRLAMLSNLEACVFAGRGPVCERASAWPIVMQNDKWAVCEPAPSIIAPARQNGLTIQGVAGWPSG